MKMADKEEEEEEDEEEKTEITLGETLIEWERIQLPSPHDRSPPSPIPDPSNADQRSSSVVFPPINHEGLNFSTAHPYHVVREIDLDRAGPQSPLPSRRPRPANGDVAAGWWGVGFQLLRCKVTGIFSSLRNYAASAGFLHSFHSLGSVTFGSMVLLLLYLRFRRWRRIRTEGMGTLIAIIKEKDERIHQLLHQIARMNEVLLAAHHKVPISGTAA